MAAAPRVTDAASPPAGGAAHRPPARAGETTPASPEEINIDEDLDLEELNELARRIERRTE